MIKYITALLGLALSMPLANASDTGVTNKVITLGQSADFTGSRSQLAKEYSAGAQLQFDAVNKRGGIFGRKIKVVSLDDKYDTPTAIANTRKLVDDEKVFALVNYVGTEITKNVAALADASNVPFLMPLAGSDELRFPTLESKNLFLLRASFADEIDRIVRQVKSQSIAEVALIYEDDLSGKTSRRLIEASLQRHVIRSAGFGIIPSKTTNVRDAVDSLKKSNPRAILLSGVGPGVRAFIKEYSALGLRPTYYTMSGVSSEALYKDLQDQSRGIVISQVVPAPFKSKLPIQREYTSVRSAQGLVGKGRYNEFEGFIAAKVITEALTRVGPALTREKLRAALEKFDKVDLGGVNISYSPKNHNGLQYVDLVIVGTGGKFVD